MSESPLSPAQRRKARAMAAVGYPFVSALGRTLRWQVEGEEHYHELMRAGRAPIMALWHGRILPATLYWRDRGIVALTSANFDGEWTALLMARLGYGAARGSSSRGGSRALVQLRRDLAAGHPAAITLDGPRGPARVIQPGAVWLAGATGHPIVPFHVEAARCWTARSWDRAQIPMPFSRVAMAIGEPIVVGATDEAALAQAHHALQARLEALEARTLQLAI